jgi:hypothetical protein
MDSLLKVLYVVFGEHWTALLLLSCSWILIYGVLKIVDLIFTKVVFELPFSFWIRSERKKIGIEKARLSVMQEQSEAVEGDKILHQLSKLYRSVDEIISKIEAGDKAISRIAGQKSLENALDNIIRGQWALLESDVAFCRALSKDLHNVHRGVLSFIGNPRTLHNETLRLLFYELKHAPTTRSEEHFELLNTVLFHLIKSIQTPKELQDLRTIAEKMAPPDKDLVEQATTEIEQKLTMAASSSR